MNDDSLPAPSSEADETVLQPPAIGPAVVALGTSAGGLAALKAFFSQIQPPTSCAFVVVVHLSPDHESHLAELVQPFCAMPVQQVTGTTKIEADRVYIIPPNANLTAVDTHLRLTRLETDRLHRAPIDHFFRTLSETHDGKAIGVILTGTGSDGTIGLRYIKDGGGLTVVQSPDEAEYDGMPRSAIASGDVDFVLPLRQIASEVLRYASAEASLSIPKTDEDLAEDDQRLLHNIFAQLRTRTGHDFTHYKRTTILRRLRRRMDLRHAKSLSHYLTLLREGAEEATELVNDLLITVTEFFRDAKVFDRLEKEVIPALFKKKGANGPIRLWSVGCATGEEAYSLAMLLLEAAGNSETSPPMQIFASDLHERSLAKAREGLYPEEIATNVSPQRLRRFFTQENGGYRIRPEVRELVLFAPHNMLRDPPFSQIDLVVCRNVLIYLQREVQRDVIATFHYALRPDGCLLLGTSESVDRTDLFASETKDVCLFRRRNVQSSDPSLPVFPRIAPVLPNLTEPPPTSARTANRGAIHERMVERYAPPSILINHEFDVVHYSQNSGPYLQHPGGEPTNNVFRLMREPLGMELRQALFAIREGREPQKSKPTPLKVGSESRLVTLRVRAATEDELTGYFVVFFEEVDSPTEEALSGDVVSPTAAAIRELQTELDLTRQRLQAVIEESESSREESQSTNEEMQSANEELRSTLEELETSKEELQSTNEELSTLNQEHRHRVEELSQLSGDLQNLLTATDIATLFLDRQLRIVRFNPRVGVLFNVRVTDRGRPISDLTHHLGYSQLQNDAEKVLESLVPIEREVSSENGSWFLTRVLPYRSQSDRIEGVVITFVDVTQRVLAERALKEEKERFRVLVEGMAQAVWETDPEGIPTKDAPSWRALTGQSKEAWESECWVGAIHPEERDVALRLWKDALASRTPLGGEFRLRQGPGVWRWVDLRAAAVVGEDGAVRKWVGMIVDIGERKRIEEELLNAREQLESRVAERTAALEEQTVRLRSLALELTSAEQRERKQLAALLHDDLQQLLVSALMRLDQLQLQPAPVSAPDDLKQVWGVVNRALEASRNLTRQLRPPVLYEGGLTAAIRWLAIEMRSLHGLEIQVEATEPEFAMSDDVRSFLFEVIREILFNVVKHSGVQEAQVALEFDFRQITVDVVDQGNGFDLQQATKSSGGSGLGLFSVRERLTSLGGELLIKSTLGAGTHVRIVAPLSDGEADASFEPSLTGEPSEPENEEDAAGTETVRVLIADDHGDVRSQLARMIQFDERIMIVGQVADGVEAVQEAERLRPEVILMDVNMPRMNGIDATREIRRRFPDVRVIALSAHDDGGTAKSMRDAGAGAFLSKAAGRTELLKAIVGD